MIFRVDIQILRSVAVLFVLLFHLGVPGFKNAYLGVDIFFVISGYLMHNLYQQEQSVGAFYIKRARRLLPAYFFVIASTIIFSVFLIYPVEFSQTSEQAIFGAVFASNIGFWLANGYFSHSEFTPLLHLWSLGVEIQFYLLFPIIFRLIGRSRWILQFIVLISFVFCVIALQISPKTSFFLLPARIWEFGIGIMAARSVSVNSPHRWAGLVAMTLLPLMLVFPLQPDSPSVIFGHPGLSAIFATLVTGVVLKFGIADKFFDNPVGRLFKYLGDISYSIYLVHFPIIVLVFYMPFQGTHLGDGSWVTALTLLPFIIVVAILLYHFVEKSGGKLVTWPFVTATSFVVVIFSMLANSWHFQRFDERTRNIAEGWGDRGYFRCGRVYRLIHPSEKFCFFKPISISEETVLLIGDSHADSIKSSFVKAANQLGITVGFSVENLPLIRSDLDANWLLREAIYRNVRRIFLHYSSVRNMKVEMVEGIRAIATKQGIQVVLIMPIPVSRISVPFLMYQANSQNMDIPSLSPLDYYSDNREIIEYINSRPPGLIALDTMSKFCNEKCLVADQKWRPFYFDDTHLTLYGARQLEMSFVELLAANGQRLN